LKRFHLRSGVLAGRQTSYSWLLRLRRLARVEGVVQAVAEEVDSQRDDPENDAGDADQVRVALPARHRGVDHRSQASAGWLDANAEVAERRLEDHGARHAKGEGH